MIGDAGLTPAVLSEIDRNLASHELIKIRVSAATHSARETMLAGICDALVAAPVQHIGKILVVFRPRPDEPKAKTRKPAHRKPPRRTKRSFQR